MKITSVNRNFDLNISLAGSKSESNRALMICHYANFAQKIENLSQADDTILLTELLKIIDNSIAEEQNNQKNTSCKSCSSCQNTSCKSCSSCLKNTSRKSCSSCLKNTSRKSCSSCLITISCQNAGTVFRFLTTTLSTTPGQWFLTGSDRMQKRPVAHLVDALRQLGADVEYQNVDGFPPLLINGKNIAGGVASVNVSQSSQYASSLLLAAPLFKNGLHLHLDGELTSLPYIDMTIEIMSAYGAKVHRENRDVFVEHSDYQNIEYSVEADWSAASYWYESVALSENGRAFLQNLKMNSTQGDKVAATIFERLGVSSRYEDKGVAIEKNLIPAIEEFECDFVNTPDLFPAVIATCAGLQLNAKFTGLKNLAIKESNRIEAMVSELRKIGVEFENTSDDILKMKALQNLPFFPNENPVVFDSHDDHRIAMSLAPLSLKIGAVEIENAETVSKSFPDFWNEFSKISMDISTDM